MILNKYSKILLFFILFYFSTGIAQTNDKHVIDLNSLIDETQIVDDFDNSLTIAWWMPPEFWEASFRSDNSMSEDEISEMIQYFEPYIMFAVADGKVSPFGSISYKSDNEILNTIQIIDRNDNSYYPILEDQIDGNIKILLGAMKPILANMIGPMGENMYFYFFTAFDKENNKIADLYKDGGFKIIIGAKELSWQLPLEAALPPQICSKCKKSLSSKFKYCPWDGAKLKANK